MRVTFLGLAAVIIIGAILVFAGPRLISADAVRDKLLAQVESSTGYRLRVSGPGSIALFPSLDLVAEDVGLPRAARQRGRDGQGMVDPLIMVPAAQKSGR
jgi:uncharacterized protein involved in outer membrane biogenesis